MCSMFGMVSGSCFDDGSESCFDDGSGSGFGDGSESGFNLRRLMRSGMVKWFE